MARKSTGNKKSVGKKNAVTLDFTGVETSSRVPDGDYLVKVSKATIEDTQDKESQYIKFQLAITEGKHAGKSLRHTNSLKANALFALRNTLEALNYEIPAGAFDLDLDAIVGLEMGVSVENEEYNGKDQSRVVDVFPTDDFEADEEEDEDDEDSDDVSDDSPSGDDEADEDENDSDDDSEDDDEDSDDEDDDDEDVEDYTEEELKAMDEEELLEAAEEYGVKPVYTGKGAKKKLNKTKTIAAILEVIEEDEE